MNRNWKGAIGTVTFFDNVTFEVFTAVGGPDEKDVVREMIRDKSARIVWNGKADIGEFIPNDDEIWKKKPLVVFKRDNKVVKVLT